MIINLLTDIALKFISPCTFIFYMILLEAEAYISLSARTMMLMKFEVFKLVVLWESLFFYCHKL